MEFTLDTGVTSQAKQLLILNWIITFVTAENVNSYSRVALIFYTNRGKIQLSESAGLLAHASIMPINRSARGLYLFMR
jgi:hypothetical protein